MNSLISSRCFFPIRTLRSLWCLFLSQPEAHVRTTNIAIGSTVMGLMGLGLWG